MSINTLENENIQLPPHRRFDRDFPTGNKIYLQSTDNLKFLLLGSTGYGKSSTANFLTQTQLFKESDQLDPCTRYIQSQTSMASFFYAKQDHVSMNGHHDQSTGREIHIKVNLTVYDTPGLNEDSEAQEIENTRLIIKSISSLGYVTMILICLPYDGRFDRQLKQTLDYYHKFLQSVFDSENWGIVLTKLPGYFLDQLGENRDSYLAKKKIELERHLGIKIPTIFYFNHRDPSEKFGSLNRQTHQELVRTAFLLKDKVLRNLLFPFPPVFEQYRLEFKNSASSCVETLNRSLLLQANDLTTTIQTICEYHHDLKQLGAQLDSLLQKVEKLNRPQYHTPIMECGKGVINLGPRKQLKIPLKSGIFQLSEFSWNCRSKKRIESDRSGTKPMDSCMLYLDVIPDWWTWTEHTTGYNWYFKLDISYEGLVLHGEEIGQLSQEIDQLQKKLVARRQEVSHKIRSAKNQNEEYQRSIDQYNELFYIIEKFSCSLISRDRFESVFNLMKAVLENDRNLASLNFSQFEDFDRAKLFQIGDQVLSYNTFEIDIAELVHQNETSGNEDFFLYPPNE